MIRALNWVRCGICAVGLMVSPLFALPTIESRTGEPVVPVSQAPSAGHPRPGSHVYPPAEDRAARLTLTQIEMLEREVSELRGLVETQEHEIKQLKKSQQDLYLDLESRLKKMQTSNTPMSSNHPISKTSKPTQSSTSVPSKVSAIPEAKAIPETKLSSPSPSVGEQVSYQAAYNLVRTKRYSEAVSALQDYLNAFPKADNVGSAHYWLGEVYMVQWQSDKTNASLLEKASNEFSTLTTQFPNHPKTVDAILKLGLIELDRGDQASAEQYLTQVKTRYPGTAAARIAETRLQQISSD